MCGVTFQYSKAILGTRKNYPNPGFKLPKSYPKILRDGKSYSGQETVNMNFYRTDSKQTETSTQPKWRSAAINM